METSSRDGILLLQTACGDAAEAQRIADALIAERLAACVQTWPVESRYTWEGRVETAQEVLLQAKTIRARLAAAIARIEALHGYDLPEVVVTEVADGSPRYLAWVRESVAG